MGAGAAINVAANSQAGFASDANVLARGPGAQAAAGQWGGTARATLADWRAASGQDARSAEGDPRFVDVDGADNVLGWVASGPGGLPYDGGADDDFYLSAGSPAIDAGHSWFAPTSDAEGSARADDPSTPNAGSPQYAASPSAAGQFARTGTREARFNNSYFLYNLPFAFPFYGTTYPAGARAYVSTGGYLHFEGPDLPAGAANTAAEFLRNRRIAPLWDNVNVGTFANADEGVYVDASAAGQVKFTWAGVNEASGAPVNFSAVLSTVFGGRLRGGLLVCRYNAGSDIICLTLDPAGNVSRAETRIKGLADLVNPLDIAEDVRTGTQRVRQTAHHAPAAHRNVRSGRRGGRWPAGRHLTCARLARLAQGLARGGLGQQACNGGFTEGVLDERQRVI